MLDTFIRDWVRRSGTYFSLYTTHNFSFTSDSVKGFKNKQKSTFESEFPVKRQSQKEILYLRDFVRSGKVFRNLGLLVPRIFISLIESSLSR